MSGDRRPVVECLAALGWPLAVVYGLIGVLSSEVALRIGGKTASRRGALEPGCAA